MPDRTQGSRAADLPQDEAAARPECRRLFSVEQAADHAGEPIPTMLDWIGAGSLEAYRLDGRRIRTDEVELDDFLALQGAGDGA